MTKQESINVEFTPANEKQRKFMFSRKSYLLYSGAVNAGKTFLLCWKVFMTVQLYPGARGLICRKEGASLTQSTLVTLFDKVIPSELIVSRNDMKGEVVLRTSNPKYNSKIVWSGLDKKASQDYPTKIGSTEYLIIAIDESMETDIGDFEMLSTRTRQLLPYLSKEENDKIPRQIICATNPEAPTHYLYKFFFKEKSEDREVILATIYDNPYASPSEIRKLETNLTGIRRERLLLGRWVQAEGAIYDTFSYEKNVSRFNLSVSVTNYKQFIGGADSNFPIPRAGVIAGITPEGEIHILAEYYEENSQPEDLARFISNWARKWQVSVHIYHDPSDPSAIEKINKFPNITCDKAMNAVLPGISCVHKYITSGKLLIDERCVNLVQYLGSYRWKKGNKEQPEKKEDHLCDATRYMAFSYDNQTQVEDIPPPMFMG